MNAVSRPEIGEIIEARYGHADVKAEVSGVFTIPCTHGEGCAVIEATTLRENPVVLYEHEEN